MSTGGRPARAARGDRAVGGGRRDIVVIGGGPAGVAAAVQLRRGGLEPLLFERDRIGGLLREAHLVENYPGFPGGIPGPALADLLAAHVERARVDVAYEAVERLERADGPFSIRTASGETFADTVIVATGTAPNVLRSVMIFGEAADRVHYGVRELGAVSGARIVIIGGGDAAFDYALNLAERNDVVILHRSGHPRCIPVLWERCAESPRVAYRANTAVDEIVAAEKGVILKCGSGTEGETERIAADRVVVAIGRAPQLDFLHAGIGERIGKLREEGLLHLIGDVANGTLRQAAISAGDGVRAAMQILERVIAAEQRETSDR